MLKADFIKRITGVMLFLNVVVIESILRQRAYEDKSIDLQVMIKLGMWVAAFFLSLAFLRVWAPKLMRLDNVLLVILLGLIGISCFYAPNFSYSAASAFSLVAVIFLLMLSSSVLSRQEMLRYIIVGSTLVAALSIIAYFVVPDFARMKEWHNGVLVQGSRLSGISGTANAIGFIAAFTLLMLYYYRQYLPRLTPAYWLFVLINAAALIMSHSRTSMAAMIIAFIAASLLCRPTPWRLALAFLAVAVVIAGLMMIDLDTLFSMLSRSGDATEITTGTGRTQIWAVSMDMIGQKPYFGWGYAANNTILPAAAAEVGFTASHAHNAYLQVAFSIGLVGLLVFIAIFAIKIYFSARSGEQLNVALIVFLLVDGLTEPIAFQGIATTTALVLATALALDYRDAYATRDYSHQQRLPGSAAA